MKSIAFKTIIFLTFGLTLKSQTKIPSFSFKQFPKSNYNIKNDTFEFMQFKVVKILVSKKTNNIEGCKCWIKILSGEKIISEKRYNTEAVGGCSGIYMSEKGQAQNYLILSKFGDYEGLTILIDSLGKINEFIGGSYYMSKDKSFLFSIWDSDLAGLSILNLNTGKKVYEKELIDEERFYTVYFQDKRYYITYEDGGFSEFDLKTLKLGKKKNDKKFLKGNNLLYEVNKVQNFKKCNCGF